MGGLGGVLIELRHILFPEWTSGTFGNGTRVQLALGIAYLWIGAFSMGMGGLLPPRGNVFWQVIGRTIGLLAWALAFSRTILLLCTGGRRPAEGPRPTAQVPNLTGTALAAPMHASTI